MNKKFKYILIACFAVIATHSCMQEPDVQPNTYRGNFEALWEIIDTRYCYLEYKNINWDSVYTVYSQRVDTVSTKYELFDLLGDMLEELKDGHVNLYSDFDISRYWEWYTDYPANFDSELIYSKRYLGDTYRIAGPFRYAKIADGRVGYMYYGSFSSSFSSANIKAVFEQLADCRGIIIDVRNNGGGLLSNAELLASYFFKEKTLTGYITHKTGSGHNDFSKPTPTYTHPNENIFWGAPVVILTNRMSYSATNDFVNRMKYVPHAYHVGDTTGGGGGMPLSSELPNGWMVRFSASPMLDAGKNNTEWGIAPDIQVNIRPIDKERGEDSIIELAVGLLH